MNRFHTIASVKIGGSYYPLQPGSVTVGKLKIELYLENKADNFYSWVVYLENDSDECSPRVQELLGLDLTFPLRGAAKFNTLRGDDCTVYSFYPESFDLVDGAAVHRSPTGARSSCVTAFPYFDVVDSEGKGFVCGIGWSGQWKLDAVRKGDHVHICVGFEDCDFYLEPHERVRSARILIYFGEGGEDHLRHSFVRLHRKHYSPIPQITPETFFPVSSACFGRYYWGNIPKPGEINYFESEDAQVHIIKNSLKYKYFNAHWLDACWFEGAFRTGVGNYRYAEGFPNSLKPISDLAHENGKRFILWFEPVRVDKDTDLYNTFKNDESKIIPNEDKNAFLVNIGDPEVWQYQFDHICKIMEENDVDIYRQDFNINPLEFLRKIEPENRRGTAQIRFTMGLYRLWDALLARFPGLLIDNCAAGGRMLDVETIMRAIPLWRSDMSCRPSPIGSQNEVLGLSKYIPYHQGSSFDYTPYALRSSVTTGIACEFGFLEGIISPEVEKNSLDHVCRWAPYMTTQVNDFSKADPQFVTESLGEAVSLREYWSGDFTALTPPSDSRDAIVAYSLRIEEEDRGIAIVFRRETAPDTFTVKLPNVRSDAEYELTFSDEELKRTTALVKGEKLLEGLKVNIAKAPGSLLIFYKPSK